MSRFTDRHGREWNLSLDLGLITKVRKALDVHLGKIFTDEKKLLELLYDDIDRLGQVLFMLVEDKAAAEKIDGDQFATGFDGPTLTRAREALVDAIANFSQPPKLAESMTASLRKVMGANEDLTAKRIELATEAMIQTLKKSDTNSAASAA